MKSRAKYSKKSGEEKFRVLFETDEVEGILCHGEISVLPITCDPYRLSIIPWQSKTKRSAISQRQRVPPIHWYTLHSMHGTSETFAYFVHNNIARRHRNRVSYVLILSFPFSLSLSVSLSFSLYLSLHFTFVSNLFLSLSLTSKHIHAVSCSH